jgi:hypothetical protein
VKAHSLNKYLVVVCCPAAPLRRRDQALAAIQESIMKQQQKELAIETEIQGYKKDIVKEQVGLLNPKKDMPVSDSPCDYVAAVMSMIGLHSIPARLVWEAGARQPRPLLQLR